MLALFQHDDNDSTKSNRIIYIPRPVWMTFESVSFYLIRQHNYHFRLAIPYHRPEICEALRDRPLCSNVVRRKWGEVLQQDKYKSEHWYQTDLLKEAREQLSRGRTLTVGMNHNTRRGKQTILRKTSGASQRKLPWKRNPFRYQDDVQKQCKKKPYLDLARINVVILEIL